MERAFKGVWFPKELWLDPDLTPQEKMFLIEISSLENCGECYASNQHFAELFKLSKDRVSRVINDLISRGYLESESRKSEDGKAGKRVLRISYPPLKTPIPHGENTDTPLGENAKQNNTNKNNTNITPCSPPKGDDFGFLEFWKAYPRHTARATAYKAWLRIKPKPELREKILASLEQHKQLEQWQRDNGQYIPHASTWLNQRRWEDELPGTTPEPQQKPRKGRIIKVIEDGKEREYWKWEDDAN